MKNLLQTILLIYSISCFSQDPNPELFQTWYLSFVQSSDMDEPYEVSEIVPSITPFLTITESLNFNGEGACNVFDGIFSSPGSGTLETIQFSSTTEDCGIQIHNNFEDSYFYFMQTGGWYEITPEGDGLVLTIGNAIFGQAIFKNFTLNVPDFDLNQIKLYPNPSSSKIFLDYGNSILSKIELINPNGFIIRIKKDDFGTVDITGLSLGIYFLKISTEFGTITKKIIKE